VVRASRHCFYKENGWCLIVGTTVAVAGWPSYSAAVFGRFVALTLGKFFRLLCGVDTPAAVFFCRRKKKVSVFCGATLSSFSRSLLTLTLCNCARAFCGFDTQQVLTGVQWRWQCTPVFGRFRGVDTQATYLRRFLALTLCSFLRSTVALPPSNCCWAFCSPEVDVTSDDCDIVKCGFVSVSEVVQKVVISLPAILLPFQCHFFSHLAAAEYYAPWTLSV